MAQEKRGRGRPQKTMEALVHRGLVPETWQEDILQMGREGKNKLHFANYLKITRNTLYRIMERDAIFLHTINEALELSEEWWVERLRVGFQNETSQKVNGQLWKYYMANVYRNEWKVEERQIDITTGGEKLNNPDNKIIVDIVLPKKDEDKDGTPLN
jgi:hypothetical protein